MRGRLVEDRIEERICKIRVIDGVIANYYPQEELIRCKDCSHRFNGEHILNCCEVLMERSRWLIEIPVDLDGFCENAERKDNETD